MRFEDVPQQINDFVETVKNDNFPELDAAIILVLFDTKKRKSGGRYVIGRIKKANDEVRVMAADSNGISPDYVMFLDKQIWDVLDDRDQERIVKHELYHCETNFESDTNQYKICDHEIQTFYAEIEENQDDSRWVERVSVIAESVYDSEQPDSPTE